MVYCNQQTAAVGWRKNVRKMIIADEEMIPFDKIVEMAIFGKSVGINVGTNVGLNKT